MSDHGPKEGLNEALSIEQRLLNTAVGFYAGGERCYEPRPTANGKFELPILPAIVCFAFSLEIFLKLLIKIETGKDVKGHKLVDLYDCLSPDSKIELEINCSQMANMKPEIIQKAMNDFSSSFVEWRYIHECNGSLTVDIRILRALCKVTYNRAISLKPELPCNQIIETSKI